ncbi:TrbC/VirB2 family protein [Dyella sp. AtDHG13]|uniref:TrbC/VirB2 family protein n=1 Tax=Dyella sp. AtDHG13 TaxID=1938897 RepID=UPI0021018CF4|nr:TrbC/VirB2 family protein [Dyella sp. AtDHG13]
MAMALFVVVAVAMPDLVFAQDLAGTDTKVCGFFGNINKLLNYASIIVVTIAIIFSGYQIAFAHKRIGDVAPVLIGGLLIGAAAQIAKMMVGGTDQCGATSGSTVTGIVVHLLNVYA